MTDKTVRENFEIKFYCRLLRGTSGQDTFKLEKAVICPAINLLANHQSGCFVEMLFPSALSACSEKTRADLGNNFSKNTTYARKIGKKSGLPETVRLIFFVWLFVWPSSLTVCEKSDSV